MTDLIHAPDWPTDRVAEARAVIADAAHHSVRLVTIACEVLARHAASREEREEARLLRLIVDARRPVRNRRNDGDHGSCGVQR